MGTKNDFFFVELCNVRIMIMFGKIKPHANITCLNYILKSLAVFHSFHSIDPICINVRRLARTEPDLVLFKWGSLVNRHSHFLINTFFNNSLDENWSGYGVHEVTNFMPLS